MRPIYETVFDLTANPQSIQPAYGFYAIFVMAGVILSLLAWLAIRHGWRSRRSLTAFAVIWCVFCSYMIFTDYRENAAIRDAVERGMLLRVEGCLDYFRPGVPHGTKSVAGNEQWSVGGTTFSYGAGEVRSGYHAVSTAGGAVDATSRVRVGYVVSPAYRRREIVKLEVAEGACPAARRVEPQAEP